MPCSVRLETAVEVVDCVEVKAALRLGTSFALSSGNRTETIDEALPPLDCADLTAAPFAEPERELVADDSDAGALVMWMEPFHDPGTMIEICSAYEAMPDLALCERGGFLIVVKLFAALETLL